MGEFGVAICSLVPVRTTLVVVHTSTHEHSTRMQSSFLSTSAMRKGGLSRGIWCRVRRNRLCWEMEKPTFREQPMSQHLQRSLWAVLTKKDFEILHSRPRRQADVL